MHDYASHVARHTSHVTRHSSHVTRHTSHVTRHTRGFGFWGLNVFMNTSFYQYFDEFYGFGVRGLGFTIYIYETLRLWGFVFFEYYMYISIYIYINICNQYMFFIIIITIFMIAITIIIIVLRVTHHVATPLISSSSSSSSSSSHLFPSHFTPLPCHPLHPLPFTCCSQQYRCRRHAVSRPEFAALDGPSAAAPPR